MYFKIEKAHLYYFFYIMPLYKIAIITCWYGPYPWYFPYFIHSCKFNPTIDFIIITDNQQVIPIKPENVILIYKEIEDIIRIATLKMGFKVIIKNAYKLCDFKPAYGIIFSDILEKYDFWGHGDIDLVYGDIRGFITTEILDEFEIVSSRHDYITGSFALYKNTDKIRRLFQHSRDYKKVFTDNEHYCFDECSFLFEHLNKGVSVLDFPEITQSMTYVVKKMQVEGKLKAFFDFIIIEGSPGDIRWEQGKIIYKNTYECMFYHLIKFKVDCKKQTVLIPIPSKFHFSEDNIHIISPN